MRNEKSATDYSYASGKVDGRAEGIAEGERKANLATARKMLSKGFSIDEISEMTGLAPDEITAL